MPTDDLERGNLLQNDFRIRAAISPVPFEAFRAKRLIFWDVWCDVVCSLNFFKQHPQDFRVNHCIVGVVIDCF